MTGPHNRPSVLVDGSLLLVPDQTGIASFARSLASTLVGTGAEVGLLLSGRAKQIPGAPAIALADQVFATPARRQGRLSRLLESRAGFRRKLRAIPVPLDGLEVAALTRPLPEHHTVLNASNFLTHSRTVFAISQRFVEIAVEQDFDLMHWTVPAAVRASKRPNIYTIHDLIPLKFPQFTLDVAGRAAILHDRIVKSADHILTMSERSREDIIAVLGVPEERISVAYQPAPPMPFVAREDAERLVSSVYSVSAGEYVFFCGAIEPKKNLLRLIEAFSIAGTDLQLVIAGPLGWLYDDVQELLERVSGRVRYLGYLPRRHIAALMQCASFFAFPSVYEGFGIPVLEAMRAGTPVLTSYGGSLPEVCGDAAIMVDPLDVSAIAAGIRELAADADLRAELVRRGLVRAKRFSEQAFAEQLRMAYRRVGVSFPSPAPGNAPCLTSSASAPSCAPPRSTPPHGAIPELTRMPTST
ncbi:MAG TPA: glycosyltransferase family 1 protein [Acetobacteraceae bacterium]|nr:glycosyltransferase family 1 protein [Acetobacteraceae bacterium]